MKTLMHFVGDVYCWECTGEFCDTVDDIKHTRRRCDVGSSACQMFITGVILYNRLVYGRHRIWHVSEQVQLSMLIKFRIILITLIFRIQQRQKSVVSPDVCPCWSTNTDGMHWSVDGFANSSSPRRY